MRCTNYPRRNSNQISTYRWTYIICIYDLHSELFLIYDIPVYIIDVWFSQPLSPHSPNKHNLNPDLNESYQS
jgi:hypothetical protein